MIVRAQRRLSDRFAEAADSCQGLPQLRALLGCASAELGFPYFALVDHSILSSPGRQRLRIDNYPTAWVDELVGRARGNDDPVHLASRRTSSGFIWDDIGALITLDRRQKAVFLESHRFGLGPGFTIPANVPGEQSLSCSFAVRCGETVPRGQLQCAELIGMHALRAARRLRKLRLERPRLSRREVECVRLIARGKTDWEIATILGLSIETVHQYVKHARTVYDVVSRTQLVILGLRDNWISLDESIPQDG